MFELATFGVAYWCIQYLTCREFNIISFSLHNISRYGSFLLLNCEIEAGDILIVSYISIKGVVNWDVGIAVKMSVSRQWLVQW